MTTVTAGRNPAAVPKYSGGWRESAPGDLGECLLFSPFESFDGFVSFLDPCGLGSAESTTLFTLDR